MTMCCRQKFKRVYNLWPLVQIIKNTTYKIKKENLQNPQKREVSKKLKLKCLGISKFNKNHNYSTMQWYHHFTKNNYKQI